MAWAAVCSACAAVPSSQAMKGAAAAAIAVDEGPCHKVRSSAIAEPYDAAAECISAARPCQAAAAASNGADPGPE
ncbi:hypothetical protein MOKP107_27420 [Mycobacterium avium subsp. hominissuis]